MAYKRLRDSWDTFGTDNPLWAVLTTDSNWDEKRFFATGEKEITTVMRYLKSQGVTVRPGKALDFGCGAGRLTRPLGKRFKSVTGVDVAPSMIRVARKLNAGQQNLTFVLNDTPDLARFKPGSFDFIYTNIVLQHIRPRFSKRYIAEFARLLAPRGVLLFQVPSEKKSKYKGLRPTARRIKKVGIKSFMLERYGKTRMEMHGIPKSEVLQLLKKYDVLVKDVRPDRDAGLAWKSYRYLAVRP